MSLIKISPECLTAVGAKSLDEFPGKLAALLVTCAGLAASLATAQGAITTLETKNGELKAALDLAATAIASHDTEIKAVKADLGNPATLTEAKIKTIATDTAKTEASRVAVEQIGAIGGAPATAAPINADKTKAGEKGFTDLVAAQIAAGKSKIEAVGIVVKSNPAAHAEWLKEGGKL